jgi:hypothetical protein
MNIEQTCTDAVAVVERYLTGDVSVYDMQDELYEAQEAADRAWDEYISRMESDMCHIAWNACSHAKNDRRDIAKAYVDEYKELVK